LAIETELIVDHYFTLTEINQMSYFDLKLYYESIKNLEEERFQQMNAEQ
jgi:hypothetical protein